MHAPQHLPCQSTREVRLRALSLTTAVLHAPFATDVQPSTTLPHASAGHRRRTPVLDGYFLITTPGSAPVTNPHSHILVGQRAA